MNTLQVFSDAGHAWAKVPLSFIKSAGFQDSISDYSYMDNEYAYLEEDCDLAHAYHAITKLNGNAPAIEEYHTEHSPIRSYDRFNVKKVNWTTCKVIGK